MCLLQVDRQDETEGRLGPVWPGPIISSSLSKHPPAYLPAYLTEPTLTVRLDIYIRLGKKQLSSFSAAGPS